MKITTFHRRNTRTYPDTIVSMATVQFPGQENRPIAILSIHGMGTHLPLTGIQDMTKVLTKTFGANSQPTVTTEHVVINGDNTSLSSARLDVGPPGQPKVVTVFEANYSSVPKGQAGLVDVVKFLFFAGWNGLGANDWMRWLFGQRQVCRPKKGTHLRLLIVIFCLLSLIGLNALFSAELFGKESIEAASLTQLTDKFRMTLCFAMVLILAVAGVFVGLTTVCRKLSDIASRTVAPGPLLKFIAPIGFVAFLALPLTVIVATIGVALRKVYPHWPIDDGLKAISPLFSGVRVLGGVVVALVVAKLLSNRPSNLKTCVALSVIVFISAAFMWPPLNSILEDPRVTVVDFWILGAGFMAASAVFRGFLLDYVGDVTAYVGGAQASKFADVREKVQCRVEGTLVHLLKTHDVVVFAHSLGSIVSYDVINRVLIADPNAPIKAFVTYGCPLDKIAYLFRAEAHHGNDVRDNLVGSRQPLLSSAVRQRIPWINVQAKLDIIGSQLAYYNRDPSNINPDPTTDVIQIDDTANLTPLASHGAYSDHEGLREACRRVL